MDKEAIFKKLRFDADKTALILNAPQNYLDLLEGISFDSSPKEKTEYDFIQIFGYQQDELENLVKSVDNFRKYDGLFWACYPKGTGKIKSNIKRETVWTALALIGLDTVTQIAIDETWSALRARPNEMVGK
ncbi:hypothetical protein LV89_01397 [Arcicella aurantiaca]|uniref:DUF3052 family protein n=1 Tax=Arcicella aurantiaca TaxID=591202 RepID=A0A316ECW8_9BACT|nr:hypothetical protein [Arcicella aurantiaca]PWK27990.1 hypothetical protein LV89_01397 [Arcicella aurantiaca]